MFSFGLVLFLGLFFAVACGSSESNNRDGASIGAGDGENIKFYFAINADPEKGPALLKRWQNLVEFMDDLEQRNIELTIKHRVTIMFTPNWSRLIKENLSIVGKWISQGHEMAFHSHTHNHQFPDGFTNATDFSEDPGIEKCDRMVATDCTLDQGVEAVVEALSEAAGTPYDLKFATIGPRSNEGNINEPDTKNFCGTMPENGDEACINAEWVGVVNGTINYHATDYPNVSVNETSDPNKLLGSSFCRSHGEGENVYSIPIAPYEIESGEFRVSLDTITEAFKLAKETSFIGIVIHPLSYDTEPTSRFSGNGREHVGELFDEATRQGIFSRTMSEIRDADSNGDGISCKTER